MIILLGQGVEIDPIRAIVALACLCWLILFAVFFPYCIVRWVYRRFWICRGFEQDGIYCAACRFDVRGGTSDHCPECGAHLLASVDDEGRLGIMVKDLTPPGGYLYRATAYALASSILSFTAVMLVGKSLPINYEPWLSVELHSPSPYSTEPVSISVYGKPSWTNDYGFDRAYVQQAEYETVRQFNDAEQRDAALIDAIWEEVVSNKPSSLPVEQRAELRDEFVAVFLAACDFDEQKAQESVGLFGIDWEIYHHPSFHPWYTVSGFLVVIITTIYLFFRAPRDVDKAVDAYFQKLDNLSSRYRRMLPA